MLSKDFSKKPGIMLERISSSKVLTLFFSLSSCFFHLIYSRLYTASFCRLISFYLRHLSRTHDTEPLMGINFNKCIHPPVNAVYKRVLAPSGHSFFSHRCCSVNLK